MPSQFKICPRCNSKVGVEMDVCQQCGAIVKDRPALAREEKSAGAVNLANKCVICGKEPEERATCPSCGVTGICGWHIYQFFSDNEKSPIGCPKCGPRCALCGAQTTLSKHGERAVCSSCLQVLLSSNAAKEGITRLQMQKLMKLVSVVITLVGVLAGIHYSTDPGVLKLISEYVTLSVDRVVYQIAGGLLGLVIGSFAAAIVNNVFRV